MVNNYFGMENIKTKGIYGIVVLIDYHNDYTLLYY